MLWTTLVLPSTCFVVWTKELLNIQTYMGVIDTPEVLAYHHSVPYSIPVKEWYEWDLNPEPRASGEDDPCTALPLPSPEIGNCFAITQRPYLEERRKK